MADADRAERTARAKAVVQGSNLGMISLRTERRAAEGGEGGRGRPGPRRLRSVCTGKPFGGVMRRRDRLFFFFFFNKICFGLVAG